MFCGHSRAVCRFSAGKTNTIEELESEASKVTCFTVHIEGSGESAPERQHCRGWRTLARRFPRGSGNFFSEVLRSRAVVLSFSSSTVIYDAFEVQHSGLRNTLEDLRPRFVELP